MAFTTSVFIQSDLFSFVFLRNGNKVRENKSQRKTYKEISKPKIRIWKGLLLPFLLVLLLPLLFFSIVSASVPLIEFQQRLRKKILASF